jgi:hypothetical protein
MNCLIDLGCTCILFGVFLNNHIGNLCIEVMEVFKLIDPHVLVLLIRKDRQLVASYIQLNDAALLVVFLGTCLSKEIIDLYLPLVQNKGQIIHEQMVIIRCVDIVEEVVNQFIK